MKIEVNVNVIEVEYRGTLKAFRSKDNRANIKGIQVEVPSKKMADGKLQTVVYIAEDIQPNIVDGKVKVYFDRYKNKWKYFHE